jgi:hypothetical protein
MSDPNSTLTSNPQIQTLSRTYTGVNRNTLLFMIVDAMTRKTAYLKGAYQVLLHGLPSLVGVPDILEHLIGVLAYTASSIN